MLCRRGRRAEGFEVRHSQLKTENCIKGADMNAIKDLGIRQRSVGAWALGVVLLVGAFSLSALAELGGGLESVKADQARLGATRQVRQSEGYTVHEMRTGTGIVVREYAAPAGTVFGVTWNGPFIPDLRQLLGAEQFAKYQQALQDQTQPAGRIRRGPIDVELPGLVVQMSGHQRAFHGRAFIPQSLPQGVQAEAIR